MATGSGGDTHNPPIINLDPPPSVVEACDSAFKCPKSKFMRRIPDRSRYEGRIGCYLGV